MPGSAVCGSGLGRASVPAVTTASEAQPFTKQPQRQDPLHPGPSLPENSAPSPGVHTQHPCQVQLLSARESSLGAAALHSRGPRAPLPGPRHRGGQAGAPAQPAFPVLLHSQTPAAHWPAGGQHCFQSNSTHAKALTLPLLPIPPTADSARLAGYARLGSNRSLCTTGVSAPSRPAASPPGGAPPLLPRHGKACLPSCPPWGGTPPLLPPPWEGVPPLLPCS